MTHPAEGPLRAAGVAIAIVLGIAGPAAAASTGGDGEKLVEELRAEGFPVDLLESKLREARLKRVPPARTRAVLEQLADAVRRADHVTSVALPHHGGDVTESDGEARRKAVSAGAAALAAGMDDVGLARTLREAGDFHRASYAAQALTSLVSRVDPETATRLVQAALQSNQIERAFTLRPALDALENAGYSGVEARQLLEREVSAGRPPLEAASAGVRETKPSRERKAQPASGASGQSDSSATVQSGSGNERDRIPGRGDDWAPPGKSKGKGPPENRGQGQGRGGR